LTSVARALAKERRLGARLKEIVMMGGAFSEECGAPITMIPLHCTHRALTTAPRLEKLRAIGTPVAEAFYHLLRFNKQYDQQQ
jgi:purine nucleosidase